MMNVQALSSSCHEEPFLYTCTSFQESVSEGIGQHGKELCPSISM